MTNSSISIRKKALLILLILVFSNTISYIGFYNIGLLDLVSIFLFLIIIFFGKLHYNWVTVFIYCQLLYLIAYCLIFGALDNDNIIFIGQYSSILLFIIIIQNLYSNELFYNVNKMILILTLISILSVVVSINTNINLVKVDGTNVRLFTIFSGEWFLYPVTVAFLIDSYINLKKKFISYEVFFIVLIVIISFFIGQRSTLLGISLIIFYHLRSIIIKMGFLKTLLFTIILFSIISIVNFDNIRLNILGLDNYFKDSARVFIIHELFNDFINNPIRILIGWGSEGWKSSYGDQEPHNAFIHFISMFGFIPATIYILYYFYLFKKINQQRLDQYFRSIAIGISPYFMFHTISTERHNIFLFALIVVMKYCSEKHYIFYKNSHLKTI